MTTSSRKAAIITGSTSGIGQAMARHLAANNYDIAVHGLDETGLDETVESLKALGARTTVVLGDVRDPAVTDKLVKAAVDAFGRIDGLANNAGTGFFRPASETSDEDWRSVFALHVDAPFRMCRTCYPHLRKVRGAIVNTSSVTATHWLPSRVAYGTAKSAIIGMTKNLAAEWAPEGIRVNAISPGTIETPLVRANFESGRTGVSKERVISRMPIGRLGKPEEVASVTGFLLSDQASYVTGHVVYIDGGWTSSGGW